MTGTVFTLVYSRTSREQIRNLHPDLKRVIRQRLDRLAENPFLGKRLQRELSGYFSYRTNRYRIIYKIKEADQRVEIHYVGHRRDIYELFKDIVEQKPSGDIAI